MPLQNYQLVYKLTYSDVTTSTEMQGTVCLKHTNNTQEKQKKANKKRYLHIKYAHTVISEL